jgi:hypothetical protein
VNFQKLKNEQEVEASDVDFVKECRKYDSCSANICPLDPGIAKRTYASGEPVCPMILDFLEGKETSFTPAIQNSKKFWITKHGENFLAGKIKSRKNVREYFSARKEKETADEI